MAVSIGDQGVLAVDTQFPELVPKINAALDDITPEATRALLGLRVAGIKD